MSNDKWKFNNVVGYAFVSSALRGVESLLRAFHIADSRFFHFNNIKNTETCECKSVSLVWESINWFSKHVTLQNYSLKAHLYSMANMPFKPEKRFR